MDFSERIFLQKKYESGLTLQLLKRKNFVGTHIRLSVNFGAQHEEIYGYRRGSAHYLEHMIFPDQEESFFLTLSEIGSDINATTYGNRTSFYATAIHEPEKALEMILKVVFHPEFSKDKFLSQKKIILQELLLENNENPEALAKMNMQRGLFKNKIWLDSIIGCDNDVKNMSFEDILKAYKEQYHPSNIFLIVVGPMDVKEIDFAINKYIGQTSNKNAKTIFPFKNEEEKVVNRFLYDHFPVEEKIIYIGYKWLLKGQGKYYSLKSAYIIKYLMKILANKLVLAEYTAGFYINLIEANLETYFHLQQACIGVRTNDSNKTVEFLGQLIEEIKVYIHATSIEKITHEIMEIYFLNYDDETFAFEIEKNYWEYSIPPTAIFLRKLSKEEIVHICETLFQEYNQTISIVN